jgi:hypothetical protein
LYTKISFNEASLLVRPTDYIVRPTDYIARPTDYYTQQQWHRSSAAV